MCYVEQPTGGDLSEREKLEWTLKYYMKSNCPEFQEYYSRRDKLKHLLTNSM